MNRGLAVSGSDHYAEVFGDCEGDLVDIVSGAVTFRELNSDCLAQKGFTIDNQVNAYGYNWSDGKDSVEQMRIDYVLVMQGDEFEIELDPFV